MAKEFGLRTNSVEDFREFDRPVLPILSAKEHEHLNSKLFEKLDQRVIGNESGLEARNRFTAAVLRELQQTEDGTLIIVTHGTMISLFVGEHNRVNSFELWKRLRSPSFVVLEIPSFALTEIVDFIS